MAFSQSSITEVLAPKVWGGQVAISWTTTAPAGSWYQLYLDRTLAWWGQRTSVRLPIPPAAGSPIRIDIGAVAAGEEHTDFSESLPSAPARRVQLMWLGGSFLATDIAGFRIFGSNAPGGAVDYGAVLADITAYPAGIPTDGYGLGGFGSGGFGRVAGMYTWVSEPLAAGTWNYAVVPYDLAGNAGATVTTSVVLAVAPLEPASFSDGSRLHYSVSGGSAHLAWNASP